MTKINKEIFGIIRIEIENALSEVAKKHGLTFTAGNIKYTDTDFTVQLKAKLDLNEEEKEEEQKRKYESLCIYYGFKKEDYGKTFVNNGTEYRVIGFEKNRRKYPVLVEDKNGKQMLFTTEVRNRLY